MNATIIKPLFGNFSRWSIGLVVKIISVTKGDGGEFCCIERLKWRGRLPIQNQLDGVPISSLRLHKQEVSS